MGKVGWRVDCLLPAEAPSALVVRVTDGQGHSAAVHIHFPGAPADFFRLVKNDGDNLFTHVIIPKQCNSGAELSRGEPFLACHTGWLGLCPGRDIPSVSQ